MAAGSKSIETIAKLKELEVLYRRNAKSHIIV